MNELIREALDEYFSDFKKYHLIILIAFVIIIALIQVIQSILVSKKIEKFKNDLKKSEIKFSKYNQLQVEALNELYPLLAELLINTVLIQQEINKASPEKINSLSENWGEAFSEVLKNYMLQRYILSKEIKREYGTLVNQLSRVNIYLNAEQRMSSLYETINNKEKFMGDFEERNEISDELIRLKKDGLVSEAVMGIKNLQRNIEKYFEKIE